MTTETYLDLTFDRSSKAASGKRPIRPKLLKLTDVTMPHRNRKKTKVKSKDRSASSVRDRIYDDPAYTDDISHLANPLRRSSCSGKGDAKGPHSGANTSIGGSSSLGKRSKLTKEFLQYAKQSKVRPTGNAAAGSYENDGSSSSADEPLRSEATRGSGSIGRRGRSLERSMAAEVKNEKKREKRERSSKQKRNLSLDNSLQHQELTKRALEQLEVHGVETKSERPRSKESRKSQLGVPKQYSDGAGELQWVEENERRHLPPIPTGADDRDELFSVHSSSVSNAAGGKMQIGRRFLRGEIGIKSFNYYLLKEGLKSSKKFVEKQRNSLTGGLAGNAGKKLHSRSEENIYEEIFFKDAPPSDEENQNQISLTQQQQAQQQHAAHHQQHPQQQQHQQQLVQQHAGTPISQCSGEEGIYADCELCMQQCTKENCEYCYTADTTTAMSDGRTTRSYVGPQQQHGKLQHQQQQQQQQQFDSLGRAHLSDGGSHANNAAAGAYINQAQTAAAVTATGNNNNNNANNLNSNTGGSGGGNLPTAHILEFQSYNPNNPGVYKIETTPVAITGEYNPILQFQQSSPSTTTTTTPSEQQQQAHAHHTTVHHHVHLQQQHQQHIQHLQQFAQQQPAAQQPYKSLAQGYLLQAGTAVPLTAAAITNSHYQSPASSNMPPMRTRSQRGHQPPQSHYIVSYNGAPLSAAANSAGVVGGSASMQRMNTKSSSSSDSLQQQQQLHKFNTMARLEAHNSLMGDPFYGGSNVAGVVGAPLLYAASRPIGGSQILVDPYELPQMYKSDSRASILSEYSLRSSDNSHRYNHRYRYGAGGRGEISDSSLGDSLFSYNSAQRRYFGSSESCRFAFECRRCSLDGGEKCSYSDTCRYECRNCDCSSSYFSSDFDEMYGSVTGGVGGNSVNSMPRSSGIPRKTAAGTLPSNMTSEYERQQEQLDLKQNKYAQDFFKHVNDVKRSIYQSEMQRNGGSMDAQKPPTTMQETSSGKASKSKYAGETSGSPRRYGTKEQPPSAAPPTACATLPLTKERARHQANASYGSAGRAISTDSSATPTPAPRTSLQQPQPSLRRTPSAYERHEYPSLDRLVASATGAIPKSLSSANSKSQASTKNNATNTAENNNNTSNNANSPNHSPKPVKASRSTERAHRNDGTEATDQTTGQSRASRGHHSKNAPAEAGDEQSTKRERYLNVANAGGVEGATSSGSSSKRHHRSSSSNKQANVLAAGGSASSRRGKDIPAPPPPSPATYSDLQELKTSLECVQQETESSYKTQQPKTKKHAKREEAKTTEGKEQSSNGKQENITKQPQVTQAMPTATSTNSTTKANKESKAKDTNKGEQGVSSVGGIVEPQQMPKTQQKKNADEASKVEQKNTQNQKTAMPSQGAMATASNKPERSNSNTHSDANDDDDVFYDARSEDSAGTAASGASSGALLQAGERKQRRRELQSPVGEGIRAPQHPKSKQQQPAMAAPQQQQPNELKIASSEHKKDENAGQLKDNSPEVLNANNETKKSAATIKRQQNEAELNAAAATEPAAMALNLAEGAATTQTLTTTTTTTATTPTASEQKDKPDSQGAITPTKRERKHHERRSSKQSSSATRHPHQQQQQQQQSSKSAMVTLTISCDTCCQLECDQQQQKQQEQQQQQQQQQRQSGETRAKQSKERASKIKAENDDKNIETTTVQAASTASSMTATTTTNPTTPIVANASQACAATLLPATNAPTTTTATAAAAQLTSAASAPADKCHKYDPPAPPTTKATTAAENGAQTGSNNKALAQTAATCSDVDGIKTSLTTTATTTTETPTSAANDNSSSANNDNADIGQPNNSSNITSVANSTVSCNSDIAGVATVSHSTCSVPTITTTAQVQDSTAQQQAKRPPLYRQDYSTCVDSSEAQSDDSHLTRDSITRESQNDELSSSTHDKIDVSTLPLPALPPKKRRTRLRASPSRHHSRRHEHETPHATGDELKTNNALAHNLNVVSSVGGTGGNNGNGGGSDGATPHLSAFQQYVAKRRESLEASTRNFNEKLEARRMHYHMGGAGGGGSGGGGSNAGGNMHMPTYLFGEHYYGVPANSRKATTNKEEIFLNKSGWVQVNTKRNNDENRSGGGGGNYRRSNYAHQNGGSVGGGGGSDPRNTIRVIQIDNTRRSDMARQALLQHQHSIALDPASGMPVYNISKYPSSKVEELIQRNEARLNTAGMPNMAGARDNTLRPGYRIVDPQLANILNERPGFLPVKNLHDADSPPPITPILSPPPAFQDSSKSKYFDRRKTIPTRQAHPAAVAATVINTSNLHTGNSGGAGGKGMVFSRSFEYDTRRKTPADTYVETFSRSFDGNLSERKPLPRERERSPNFSTLTGNSPNYLTKKDSGGGSSGSLRSRDNSPKYQQPQTTAYLNTSIKEAPPAYSLASNNASASRYSPRARHERAFERSKSHNVLVRSRKSQFNRVASSGPLMSGGGVVQAPSAVPGSMSRFRSFDTTMSQRLNSCDSGARSDLSNDELDCDDDEGSSEFLTTTNYHHSISPLKTQRQRSLTPDRNESHSSSSSLRKQRSLTPESRSLTPEDRRKKTGSQASLMGSRQNSSSRSNTLERKQRLDEKTTNISRSSSSSSYSGREAHEAHVPSHLTGGGGVGNRSQHRRSLGRSAKQASDEHRIRRSRSLQLSERSPNRSHKVLVSGAVPGPQQAGPIYQQANLRSNISNGGSNFPPTIRTSSKSQSILLTGGGGGGSLQNGRVRNSDIDKSRSFDFDYCNYNNTIGATVPKGHSVAAGNQNVPMRLDFDKSRSFDDDYREPINSANNNLNGMRYLQTAAEVVNMGGGSTGRLRRSSPVGSGGERNSRSPQSSGSSCNNLNLPRQSTSPQSYGTRLCDHELTYDMLRKSLDRSPIMDFRRGDSGDYELPQSVIRNRETINSGGNSELNFFNNDTHIYEQPTLKQQRALGHTQSPSDSQYSLERLHSSRDSITPEGAGSDYRGDYIYRQPQSQAAVQRESARGGSSRGSSHKITTTKTTPKPTRTTAKGITTTTTPSATTTTKNNNTKTPTRQLIKSPSTNTYCSFWPHCGACNTRTDSPQALAIKRQNSLQNQTMPMKCQNARHQHASVTAAAPLRRNHSAHLANERGIYDAPSTHVSTISINVQVQSLQLDNCSDPMPANNVAAGLSSQQQEQRNKSQWTLLCSGATPTPTSTGNKNPIRASVTPTKPTMKITNLRDTPERSASLGQQPARVIPLAATSLVFLGDCEMPITRERDFVYDRIQRQRDNEWKRETESDRKWENENERGRERVNDNGIENENVNERNDKRRISNELRANVKNRKYAKKLVTKDGGQERQSQNGKHLPINHNVNGITTPQATATVTKSPSNFNATTQRGEFVTSELANWRNRLSVSLPELQQATSGLAKVEPVSDGTRSSFSINLSHQLRAVSSPSLTDAIQQEAGRATSMQLTSTSANTTSASGESTPTAPTSASTSHHHSATLPTSQSVGVLQKFKRTLTNFNKTTQPQQQPPPPPLQQHQHEMAPINGCHMNNNTPTLLTVGTGSTVTADSQKHDGIAVTATTTPNGSNLDVAATSKYRFGPLIWRSSKERRKTKYNRRDKCNSGDSGIQIELENDEQFARMLSATNAGAASNGSGGGGGGVMLNAATTASSATTGPAHRGNNELLGTPKLRTVRRTNSAKACNITDQTTATLSAKAKILKRMEQCNTGEREAPESLPTRSLSQPNGLETFGIGRTDLDDSDSDSVASHDDGPNYYPVYAEVLYSFTAAGPQELGLERGTLIEVLRKEVGPWWFGRIKKEESTLVEEILDPELGWFPKEFVRIIQCPETDTFFLSQISHANTTLPALPTASNMKVTTTTAVSGSITAISENKLSGDASVADAIVDENNVTTIVIESPPPPYNNVNNSQSISNSSSIACIGGSGNVCDGGGEHNALAPSRSINVILDSADMIRRSAVKELLDTEVNYVKLLASICEGYLPAMSKRIDIFSPNSIRLIFSNITAIYKFQRKFLDALRRGIEQNQIAKVFLKMHKGFLCYSTYCNAYPRALIELESYDRIKDAKTILDNCRESENLAELPLSAHLLAPVQRICRYPLHLAEIIKNATKSTEPSPYELSEFEQLDVSQLDIPDTRETIDMALEAMKSITEAVNEGKRHSETIARHQASFQNFKGPPLHLHSTRFFLQIDATRQKQNLWNSSCTLFLFDNQLIYCKRDIIKRSQFIYKGRIFLDRCRVVNVRDGKMFGHTIKNSLRIYCEARDKWYDFSFRSANRKHRFLSTLALERQFGGKALYVSEMTGFEYAFEERDYSDQSDYEMPECEGGSLAVGHRHWSMADMSTTNGTSASGDSSVPDSPVKYKYSDTNTLPKKSHSQTREASGSGGGGGGGGNSGAHSAGECQTGSLGRRRLGNWFRKPKSSNSTPNHSPTHKPSLPVSEQQLSSMENTTSEEGSGDNNEANTAPLAVTTVEVNSEASG